MGIFSKFLNLFSFKKSATAVIEFHARDDGSFQIIGDWNKDFIIALRKIGYDGYSEDDVFGNFIQELLNNKAAKDNDTINSLPKSQYHPNLENSNNVFRG